MGSKLEKKKVENWKLVLIIHTILFVYLMQFFLSIFLKNLG